MLVSEDSPIEYLEGEYSDEMEALNELETNLFYLREAAYSLSWLDPSQSNVVLRKFFDATVCDRLEEAGGAANWGTG